MWMAGWFPCRGGLLLALSIDHQHDLAACDCVANQRRELVFLAAGVRDRASYSASGGAKQTTEAGTRAQHHERREQWAGAKQTHVRRRHLRQPADASANCGSDDNIH